MAVIEHNRKIVGVRRKNAKDTITHIRNYQLPDKDTGRVTLRNSKINVVKDLRNNLIRLNDVVKREFIGKICGSIQGPPGPPGTPGGGTWQPLEAFTLTATDIANGFVTLSSTPLTNSEFVFVNGMFEDCYTVVGSQINFSALGLLEGEKLVVRYQT